MPPETPPCVNLEEYLRELRECPDEELSRRCGIYDNWPILLRADFTQVVTDLVRTGRYSLSTMQHRTENVHWLDFTRGTVRVQIRSRIGGGVLRGSEEEKQHQLKNYSLVLMLHPYQSKEMPEHWLRGIALVAQDLMAYASERELPFCLPHATGWDHLDGPRRIIYHP